MDELSLFIRTWFYGVAAGSIGFAIGQTESGSAGIITGLIGAFLAGLLVRFSEGLRAHCPWCYAILPNKTTITRCRSCGSDLTATVPESPPPPPRQRGFR